MARAPPWSQSEIAKLRAAARNGPIGPAMQRHLAIELKRSTAAVAIQAGLMGLVQLRGRYRKEPREWPLRDDGRYAKRLRKVAARQLERPPGFEVDRRPCTRRPLRVDVLAATINVV